MTNDILHESEGLHAPNDMASSAPLSFDAEGYTAFGSFNPMYRNVWLELMRCYPTDQARQIYFVLMVHIMHANEIGIHFAGYETIMEIACYSETIVKRAEIVLGELGWIKTHFISDPTNPRGKKNLRIQINPHVLWIAQPFIELAMEWWAKAVPFDVSQRRNVIIHVQPESESRIRIQKQNHLQNQNQEPPKNFPEGEEQTRKRPQAASYPGEVDLETCKKPLTDQTSETFAQAIAAQYRTHVPQARQIVLSYGAAAVTQEIDKMLIDVQNGVEIIKPMGYLRGKLRQRLALAMVGQENRALVKEVFKESFNR